MVLSHINDKNSLKVAKIFVLLIALLLLLVTIGGTVGSFFSGFIEIEEPGVINVISILGFVALCILSLHSYRIYFFLLPYIFLGYPAAVNDFFPSVFLGPDFEAGASLFPIITHIDIYLVVGIVKKLIDTKGKFNVSVNALTLTVIVLFLLSSLVNMLVAKNMHQFTLLIAGLFPLRYIILLLLLISNCDIPLYEKQIVKGLMFSIFFLLLESTINTKINNTDELNSGTLATNTFANITTAVVVFIIFLRRQNYPINTFIFYSLLAAQAAILIFTETRMALLAGIVAFFLIQFLLFKWYKTFFVFLGLGLLIVVIYNLVDVPERYSVKLLLSKIRFHEFSLNLYEMVSIELSKETSSIISRLKLYQTALNMLSENPVWGTGYGTFDYLKNEYGFDEYVLIDAHNGYLNTLCQMGFSSVFFLYFIYLSPLFNFKGVTSFSFLKYLFVINLVMAIADFSNAGIYKPSVFALMAFISLFTMQLKRRSPLPS